MITPKPEWLFAFPDIAAKLPDEPGVMRFHYALRHGTMKIGLYAPRLMDDQTPHMQDELYIIAAGSGFFVKNGDRRAFNTRDVIFVEAGLRHWFEDFTADFAAWVIFWGGGDGLLRKGSP